MKDFLKDKLGKHEMIGALEIRDALPRTAVRKLSKKELNEALPTSADHSYDLAVQHLERSVCASHEIVG